MDIANTLKEFRRDNGLEQEDLAKLLETTQQTISNWESGTMPRAGALKRINHLLSTYKKGEVPKPYIPPASNQLSSTGEARGVYPTMTNTTIPVEELSVRPTAARTLEDEEGKDESLPRKTEGQVFKDAIFATLPTDLIYAREPLVQLQDLKLRADYLDSNICLTFRYVPPRSPNAWARLEHAMFHLISIRLLHRLNGNEKKSYVLLVGAPAIVEEFNYLHRVLMLAALHGVRVTAAPTPEQCAHAIAQITTESSGDEFSSIAA